MNDGRDVVRLRADDGGSVELRCHGAHVTSWRTPEGTERLFLSADAILDGTAAIRGGVPVIFPQFAAEGPLPKHGFARTARWRLADVAAEGAAPYAVLELTERDATLAEWPHPYSATFRAELVNGSLRLSLAVHNSGDAPFEFTAALHTYLRVRSAFTARVLGLQGTRYRDSTEGGVLRTQSDAELAIRGEVNRIYLGVPGIVEVIDGSHHVRSAMRGFDDVVVWNPGREGEAALGDMEPGGAAHMLCIEAAAIGRPVPLAPDERWSGAQRLTAD